MQDASIRYCSQIRREPAIKACVWQEKQQSDVGYDKRCLMLTALVD